MKHEKIANFEQHESALLVFADRFYICRFPQEEEKGKNELSKKHFKSILKVVSRPLESPPDEEKSEA